MSAVHQSVPAVLCNVCEAMFDRDRSGSIELHEFQSLWTYIGQWRQVFDQYDRDRSGAIDGGELHNSKLLLALTPSVTDFLFFI